MPSYAGAGPSTKRRSFRSGASSVLAIAGLLLLVALAATYEPGSPPGGEQGPTGKAGRQRPLDGGKGQRRRHPKHGKEPKQEGTTNDSKEGGWGTSFLLRKVDKRLTKKIDASSKKSRYMQCHADSFGLNATTAEAELLVFGGSDSGGGPDAKPAAKSCSSSSSCVLSVVARGVPCKEPPPGSEAPCCDVPLTFRKDSTDYKVFQQVFPYHYMRFLYTLFEKDEPQYILDAGANGGFSATLFKLLWPNATVVCLEPDPSNYEALKRNTATYTKVHTMNAGLWGRQAKIKLTGDHGNWGRIFKEAAVGEDGMPAYNVKDVAKLHGIPAFDFVKIDIEGAEGMVFSSESDVSWIPDAKIISLEVHDYFAHYFGLKDVSSHIDAAFQTVEDRFTMVSDDEHVLYINALKPGKVA